MRIVIRILKITLMALLSLAAAVIVAWCVLTYLIWPKPDIRDLVPGTPLAYIAASGLGEALPDLQESEFVNRVARSPLWGRLKLSRPWIRARKQRRAWEKQMQASINPKGIIQLVEKDAVLAFYGGGRRLDFLLVSEVDTLTRMNVKSGTTEKSLSEIYEFTKEKYRGAELITLAVPEFKLSYGFIGRAGMLSTDVSLLKKCVDLRKGTGEGMSAAPEYKKLVADMPRSEISIHINAGLIRAAENHPLISSLTAGMKSDPRFNFLRPITQHVDSWIGAGSRQSGDLAFDMRACYNSPTPPDRNGSLVHHPHNLDDLIDDKLPVPADSMLFAAYEMLELDVLFETLSTITGSSFGVISDKLIPALYNGAAVAILEPNIKELQLLPPVVIFFQLKDKTAAQAILKDLSESMGFRGRQLEFTDIEHDSVPITCARVPIGMGMSIDAGYTFIGDDLMVVATDTSALEAAIDVSLGKKPSLMKDGRYVNVLAPIVEASEGRVFVNIKSAAAITKQAGKLYAWRSQLAGERKAEQIATVLYQNVFILEAWQFMGVVFDSEDGKTNLKMILRK